MIVSLSRARPLIACVLAILVAGLAAAAPTFPRLSGRVVDDAGILSPQTEQALATRLEALENTTHRQVVVVTLRSLQGYPIEDYGYQLGRAWGIGRAREDDGALLIVAPSDRQVRIEIGYGLEPILTDALSSVILNTKVLPRFRDGDLEGGVVAGADALIAQLALPDDEAKAAVAAAAATQTRPSRSDAFPIIFVMIIVFFILSRSLGVFGSRRPGSSGWWLLPLLLSGSDRRDRHGGGGGGWGGGGGFSGGGGSFGGGGSSGSW